jgi:hypothetical protein
MNKVRALSYALAATLALAVAGGSASAQETAATAPVRGGFGIGYAGMLGSAPSGLNLIFDGGRWHADAIMGVEGGDGTGLDLAARGWFHLHQSNAADLSLGGGLGIIYRDPDGPPDSTNIVRIDVGAMIRAFITSNVAVSAFGGLGVSAGDGDGFALTGQPLGSLGLAYYFW